MNRKVFTLHRAVSRRPKRVHVRKRKGKTGLRGSYSKTEIVKIKGVIVGINLD
uniref:Uncharacterized protein n=1 Tax=Helianthus annuus TaxID=4232 RepID=A0A251U353_HELAN